MGEKHIFPANCLKCGILFDWDMLINTQPMCTDCVPVKSVKKERIIPPQERVLINILDELKTLNKQLSERK